MSVGWAGKTVSIGSPEEWGVMPPHRVIPLLAILLALRDGAETLTFEPSPFGPDEIGLRMLYSVSGTTHELVPPPALIAPKMALCVKRMAVSAQLGSRLRRAIRRLVCADDGRARDDEQGRFQLCQGEENATLHLTIEPCRWGERLHLTVIDRTEGLAAYAHSFLTRLVAISPHERFTEKDLRHYKGKTPR